MSVRIRRLYAEYERLKTVMEGYQHARIIETFGRPPEKYIVEYHVRGLTDESGEIRERNIHRAEINLGPAYPKEMPRCVMLTPVFHPNIDHLAVCTEDIGSAGQTLDQVIVFIAELVSFQAYNLQSPRNGDAARWTKENQSRIPVDTRNLFPPVWLDGRLDIEIAHAVEAEHRKMLEEQSAELLPVREETSTVQGTPADRPIRCVNCGRSGLLAGLALCLQHHRVCEDCTLSCSNCTATVCLLCAKRCSACSSFFCDDCCQNCNQCLQLVCLVDIRMCKTCKEWVCKGHFDLPEQCPSCAASLMSQVARLTAGR